MANCKCFPFLRTLGINDSNLLIPLKAYANMGLFRNLGFLCCILWKCILANEIEGDYEISPFKLNPGLYYEKDVNIRIFHAKWKLVTAIGIQDILEAKPDIRLQIVKIENLCKTQAWKHCPTDSLNLELERKLTDASRYEEILRNSLGKPKFIRSRRSAPLSFIGTISNALFGTLTETDAMYYNQEIDKIYKDQKHLSELLGNQTHIIRSQFQDIHQDLLMLKNSSQIMNNRIKEIATGVIKLNEIEAETQLQLSITSWTYQIARHVDDYISAIIILTDAIMFAKLGMLHPAILTPDQIITSCIRINQSTPYEFPLTPEELRSEDFKKIVNINVAYLQGRILVSLEIPLLDKIPFDLYKLHPCPSFQTISHNVSSAVFIMPRTPYLAINEFQQEYFLPSENFMQSCKQHPRMYICELTLALRKLNDASICETELLVNPQLIDWKRCNTRSLKASNVFVKQLTTPNTWLYSIGKKTPLQIKCNHHASGYEELQGSGILKLKRNCQASIDNIRLIALDKLTIKTNLTFQPPIGLNISQLIPNLTPHHVKIISDQEQKLPLEMLHENMNKESIALEEIEKQAQELATHHRTQQLTTYATYGLPSLGGIIIAIGIFWIIIKYRKGICARKLVKSTKTSRGNNILEMEERPPTKKQETSHIQSIISSPCNKSKLARKSFRTKPTKGSACEQSAHQQESPTSTTETVLFY